MFFSESFLHILKWLTGFLKAWGILFILAFLCIGIPFVIYYLHYLHTMPLDEQHYVVWIAFKMSLHYSLPLLIIAVEGYMLSQMAKEKKEREKTTEALQSFRAALGRQTYLEQIVSSINYAQREVVFTTATMNASYDCKEQKLILEAVKKKFKEYSNRGTYSHKGLVAKRPEALPGVVELLCFTGVELRMNHVMNLSKLRFLVQDNERCVLGIADSILHRNLSDGDGGIMVEPSRLSFSLDSTMMALALRSTFNELWQKSSDPWEYINEFIKSVEPKDDAYTQLSFLKWLKADKMDLKVVHQKLLEKCSDYKCLKEYTAH